MSIVNMARETVVWKAINYYENKKVVSWEENADGTYDGIVQGSGSFQYKVHLDLSHPRKNTTCNCPFADGKQTICKHMLALYFTVNPQEVEKLKNRVEEYDDEDFDDDEDTWEDEYYEPGVLSSFARIRDYVYSLSKQELQSQLISALLEIEENDINNTRER